MVRIRKEIACFSQTRNLIFWGQGSLEKAELTEFSHFSKQTYGCQLWPNDLSISWSLYFNSFSSNVKPDKKHLIAFRRSVQFRNFKYSFFCDEYKTGQRININGYSISQLDVTKIILCNMLMHIWYFYINSVRKDFSVFYPNIQNTYFRNSLQDSLKNSVHTLFTVATILNDKYYNIT